MTQAAEPSAHPERGRHDKEGRQRALLEAAVEVFAEHGYDAATTRQVAERAGCAEGLIHRYFGGKRGLLLAAIEEKHTALADGLMEAISAAGSIEEKIVRLVMDPIEVIWQARAFMRIGIAQSIVEPEIGRKIGDLVTGVRVAFMVERLGAHQRAGELREDIDVEALAETISAASFAFGFMEQIVFGKGRERARTVAREAARIICNGVLPQDGIALAQGGGAV